MFQADIRQPHNRATAGASAVRTASSSRELDGGGLSASSPAIPSISLPTGGGAIRGMGEKFAANPVTGTNTHADDIATFILRFVRGATAQCLLTQATDGFYNDIYDGARRISLRGVGSLSYALEVVSTTLPAYAEPVQIRSRVGGDPKLAMLKAVVTEFAGAITERRPPAVMVHDGRQVLRILDAVAEAK